MEGLWKNGPIFRLYGGVDYMYYYRTRPERKVLTRTTPDLFPGAPGFLNADGDQGNLTRFYGVNTTQTPNDPNLNQGTITEFLSPNEVRMTTDDLDTNGRSGYRPKIGIVLSSGNKVEFSYMWFDDFQAPTAIDDMNGAINNRFRGAAFQIGRISSTPNLGFFDAALQRFGYLNAPFFTRNPQFAGEVRRTFGPGAITPHDPQNESPSLDIVFPGTVVPRFQSGDIPREPTNLDYEFPASSTSPNAVNFPIAQFGSFLWRDGELAAADYSFDLQGGDLVYKRNILAFTRNNWELTALFGVRYIGMDEFFSFRFADTVFDRRAANPTQTLDDPSNPFHVLPVSQPQSQTEATYTNTIDNDMFGPQIGMEAKFPFYYYFDIELMGKGGFVVNELQNRVSTYRGDGLILNDYTKNVTTTGGIIEGRFGINFHPIQRVTIFGGYEFLWLKSVGTAIGNINFDLDEQRRPGHNEDVLFHGAVGRVEVVF